MYTTSKPPTGGLLVVYTTGAGSFHMAGNTCIWQETYGTSVMADD